MYKVQIIWHFYSSLYNLHVERWIKKGKVCRCSTGSIWSSLCINKREADSPLWGDGQSQWSLCMDSEHSTQKDDMLSCTKIFRDCAWCQMKVPGVYTALQDKHLKRNTAYYIWQEPQAEHILVSLCVLICFCTSYKPSCEMHYHYCEEFLLSKSSWSLAWTLCIVCHCIFSKFKQVLK